MARQHHDFSRLHVLPAGPLLQRKLEIDEQKPPATPELRPALERLAGRPLVPADDGGWKLSAAAPPGGSPTIAGYIRRATESKQTYCGRRVGHRRCRCPGRCRRGRVRPAHAVGMAGGEIVVSIRRSHLGDLTWTADEFLAEKIVEAVARFDPSGKQAPAPVRAPGDSTLPPKTEDELLTTLLNPAGPQEKLDRMEGLLPTLTHLTPAQQRLFMRGQDDGSGDQPPEDRFGLFRPPSGRTRRTVAARRRCWPRSRHICPPPAPIARTLERLEGTALIDCTVTTLQDLGRRDAGEGRVDSAHRTDRAVPLTSRLEVPSQKVRAPRLPR